MLPTFLRLALLALLSSEAICSPLALLRRQSPGPPSTDPFYVPPSGFDKLPLGSILRNRSLPGVASSYGLHGVYQLLYSSQDDVGRKGATVTTVLVPNNADYTRHFAYHSPYDTADVNCSPSYGLAQGQAPGGLDGEAISYALQRGIPVSTPDYEGPDAAFTAGPQTAYGTLDALKAVQASQNITGILPSAKTVMFGYSGGSIAVEWASEYHASYAPKVNIIGAALGGLPVNLYSALSAIAASSSPGLAVASLNGLAASYPSFASWLDGALVPSKKQAFYQAKTSCNLGIYNNQNVYSYFTNGSATFNSPQYTSIIDKAGIMGRHGVPNEYPLYVYKGTADEIVPTIGQTDSLIQYYCNNGATIKYYRVINGTHGSAETRLTPSALDFLSSVLNGTVIPKGCTAQNVTL